MRSYSHPLMTCTVPATDALLTATAPSDWVQRFAHLLAPHARVLDVACGRGRHAAFLAALGHDVTGIDRDAQALDALPSNVTAVHADIEHDPWPLAYEQFDAVVVTNYLWRPLWPQILGSVRDGGVLIYETFGHGNAEFGKPSRPDFLLQPSELLRVCTGWQVVAYEHGLRSAPDRVVQRIAAIKPSQGDEAVPLHVLP